MRRVLVGKFVIPTRKIDRRWDTSIEGESEKIWKAGVDETAVAFYH